MQFYLVGAGVIAKSHVDAIRKLPNANDIVIKVADPNPAALNNFSELYPEVITYSDSKEMLEEEARQDDVVIVCTPPWLHFEFSKIALESGRHALCEKPLVMNTQQAEELLAIAKKNNRMVSCCSARFLGIPKTEEVKRALNAGILGDIYKVTFVYRGQRSRPGVEYQPESRWFLERAKSGGGIVMDWGPYDFAVLNDLFNPTSVEVSSAWMSKPETEVDPTDCVYDIEGHVGALLKYHVKGRAVWVQYERSSCTHGESYHHVEIEGTKGAISWSPYFEGDKIILRYDKNGEVITEDKEILDRREIGFMDHPVHLLYKKINGEPSLAITNVEALFNLSCLRAIYDCVESGVSQKIYK